MTINQKALAIAYMNYGNIKPRHAIRMAKKEDDYTHDLAEHYFQAKTKLLKQ